MSLDELLRALKDVKIFLYKSDEAFLALQVTICVFCADVFVAYDGCKISEAVGFRMLLLWRQKTLPRYSFEIPGILWLAVL